MKTFYKTCLALFLLIALLPAYALFAQEEPTKPRIGKQAHMMESWSVQPAGMTEKDYAKYKKNAEKIPGVKVLGYCKGENLVLLEIDRNVFMTSIPAGKISQEMRDNPEKLDYDHFFMFLANNLTVSTGVSTQMSQKPVFEVMNKCPDCIDCKK